MSSMMNSPVWFKLVNLNGHSTNGGGRNGSGGIRAPVRSSKPVKMTLGQYMGSLPSPALDMIRNRGR